MISEKGMPAPKPQNAGSGIKIVLGQLKEELEDGSNKGNAAVHVDAALRG
jgi:hypothetical protein